MVSTAGRVVMENLGCCELLGHKDYREVTEPVEKSENTGLEWVADLALEHLPRKQEDWKVKREL